jgi:antitoxin (DNA-binding transcriptional repressor) of toxin-antitoxin stability system
MVAILRAGRLREPTAARMRSPSRLRSDVQRDTSFGLTKASGLHPVPGGASVEQQRIFRPQAIETAVLGDVATSGYNRSMTSAGIRELKDNLSRYIRRIEAGERIAITAHGRVVAELVPPGTKTEGAPSRFDELVASGVIRPPLEDGDPTAGWPDIRLPAGTALALIDADRGEA